MCACTYWPCDETMPFQEQRVDTELHCFIVGWQDMEVTNEIPGQPPRWCSVGDVTSSRQPIVSCSILNPSKALAVWAKLLTYASATNVFATSPMGLCCKPTSPRPLVGTAEAVLVLPT